MKARIGRHYIALAMFLNCGVAICQEKSPPHSGNVLYAELSKAPKRAAARGNPMQNDPDAVPAGAKLFAQHCAECHGQTAEGGKGSKKGPSLRADEVQQATAGTLFWLLSNGVVRRGMPVWSKLPEPQRWQLVRFIKSLRPDSQHPTP
jgi:mono/diheme cytochrome c family protein